MRLSILAHGAVALLLLLTLDRLWPIWPIHLATGIAASIVAILTALALVAARKR
jgi:hypothetical protein